MNPEKEKTAYGYKIKGEIPVVFVAPHAGGDDLFTGSLVKKITQKMKAYGVVNNTFFKPRNKRAEFYPERVEDFNRLSWGKSYGRYLWKKKKPAMKLFFDDIVNFSEEIKKKFPEKKPLIIYIHGMVSDKYLFDLGVGLRAKGDHQNKFRGTAFLNFSSSGVPTLPLSFLKKIKNLFIEEIADFGQSKVIGVGVFPAWSRRVAIQFHKNGGRDDWALQLEVNQDLRITEAGRARAVEIVNNVLQKSYLDFLN